MSKQMRKTLGIFLAVCFLMSITAAAVSADPVDKSITSQKYTKGVMQGIQGKEMTKGKPVVIRNLIIARNVVIFNGRNTRPLIRAAVLKGMTNNRMTKNTGTTGNTGTIDNTGTTDNTGTADNTGITNNPCENIT
jgi:hypothetical protein